MGEEIGEKNGVEQAIPTGVYVLSFSMQLMVSVQLEVSLVIVFFFSYLTLPSQKTPRKGATFLYPLNFVCFFPVINTSFDFASSCQPSFYLTCLQTRSFMMTVLYVLK